jgi:hypothetical protein
MVLAGVDVPPQLLQPAGAPDGPVLTSLPGTLRSRVSATFSDRCSGTNCSLTTMSLLPVPISPEACQTSTIV